MVKKSEKNIITIEEFMFCWINCIWNQRHIYLPKKLKKIFLELEKELDKIEEYDDVYDKLYGGLSDDDFIEEDELPDILERIETRNDAILNMKKYKDPLVCEFIKFILKGKFKKWKIIDKV